MKDKYSRKIKENNAETLLYEVDLLRFARERLLSPQSWWTQLDEWLYLEDFLLHFRNLIEFFGKPKPGDGDLSILRPELVWFDHVPDKADLDSMTRLDLWEKYDTRDNDEAISKYLHHCTIQRTAAKDWDVKTMYEDLLPVIERFERLLPEHKPTAALTKTYGDGGRGLDGNSTTGTRILGSAPNLDK